MNPDLYLFRISVVLINSNVSFSLFSPNQLSKLGIAKKDWTADVAGGSEAISIKYNNGVDLHISGSKLIIAEIFGEENVGEAEFPSMVESMLGQMTHLDFIHLGINCDIFVKNYEPTIESLVEIFSTSSGLLSSRKHKKIPIELISRVVLPEKNGHFRLDTEFHLEAGKTEQPALIFHSNRHFELQGKTSKKRHRELMMHVSDYFSHTRYVQEVVSDIIPNTEDVKNARTGT